jgi:hypothetical protein
VRSMQTMPPSPRSQGSQLTTWRALRVLELSNCGLSLLDRSLTQLPALQRLGMDFNDLRHVGYLGQLSHLLHVNLSHNRLGSVNLLWEAVWGTQLPLVVKLTLSHNQLVSLAGLSACRNLRRLDVRHNLLTDLSCLAEVARMPALDSLQLVGNPLCRLLAPAYRLSTVAELSKLLPSAAWRHGLPVLDGRRVTAAECAAVRGLQFESIAGAAHGGSFEAQGGVQVEAGGGGGSADILAMQRGNTGVYADDDSGKASASRRSTDSTSTRARAWALNRHRAAVLTAMRLTGPVPVAKRWALVFLFLFHSFPFFPCFLSFFLCPLTQY